MQDNSKEQSHAHKHEHNLIDKIVYNSHSFITNYKVLCIALATALLSTIVFIFGSKQAGIADALSLSIQWMMMAGHVLGIFGNSVLLWGGIRAFSQYYENNTTILYSAAVFVFIYHIIAAIGYAYGYMFSSYLIVISTAWGLKTITGCYVAVKFMVGNKYYRDDLFLVTGVVMLVSYVTNSPLALPGDWGLAQWVIAKLTAMLLVLLLFWNCIDDK